MKKLLLTISILILSFSSVGLKPGAVQAADAIGLRAVSGPKTGEVTLTWNNSVNADNFHLVYGTNAKDMKYGVLNIGKGRVYTVGKLAPGAKYYFALVPVAGNRALYTSEWAQAVAVGASVVQSKPVTSVAVSRPTTPAAAKALSARPGPRVGEVTLTWKHIDGATDYHLVYGTKKGEYQYGALNIGSINSFTVKSLVAGKTYYFALVPVKGNTALYTSEPASSVAKENVQTVETTREALMQSLTTSPPATGSNYPSTTSGQ